MQSNPIIPTGLQSVHADAIIKSKQTTNMAAAIVNRFASAIQRCTIKFVCVICMAMFGCALTSTVGLGQQTNASDATLVQKRLSASKLSPQRIAVPKERGLLKGKPHQQCGNGAAPLLEASQNPSSVELDIPAGWADTTNSGVKDVTKTGDGDESSLDRWRRSPNWPLRQHTVDRGLKLTSAGSPSSEKAVVVSTGIRRSIKPIKKRRSSSINAMIVSAMTKSRYKVKSTSYQQSLFERSIDTSLQRVIQQQQAQFPQQIESESSGMDQPVVRSNPFLKPNALNPKTIDAVVVARSQKPITAL